MAALINQYFGQIEPFISIGNMPFLRQSFFLILISISSLSLFGEEFNPDSLSLKLKNTQGKEKCDILNQLSNYYLIINPDKSLEYAQQSFILADENIYPEGKSLALTNMGLYYLQKEEYKTALENLNRGYLTAKATDCKKCKAETSFNLAEIYYKLGNYEKALKCLSEASGIYDSLSDKNGKAICDFKTGEIFIKLENFQLAKSYLEKALIVYTIAEDKLNLANTFLLLGEAWSKTGNYQKSIKFLEEALTILKKYKKDISTVLFSLAENYEKSKGTHKAVEIFKECQKLALENDNLLIANKCRLHLGHIYLKKAEYEKAEVTLNECYKFAVKETQNELLVEVYNALSELYNKNGNFSLAYKYLMLHTALKDSTFSEENARRIANLQISYNADEKQKQNEILRKNFQIQSLQIAKQRDFTITLILLFSTFLLIVFFIFFLYHNKRKSNKLLIESNNEINRQKNQLEEILVKLNTSENRNIAMLQAIPDIIFLVDSSGIIKEFRIPTGSKFFEINSFEIGKSFTEVLPAETSNSLIAIINSSNKSIEVEACEFQYKYAEEIYEYEGRAVKAADNLFLLIIRDMTERKQLERRLVIAKNEAEKATNSKSMYLATMSHEIRTPLSGIIGISEILKDTNLSRQQLEYVDIIYNSGNSLLTIINDVLDFSKVEAGQLTLDKREFDLSDVIQETTNLLYFKAKDKGIQLFTSISQNIPNSVFGDPSRLLQILMNLTNNAIKFTHEGSVTIECKAISTDNDKITIRFNIVDTGVGITEEDRNNLFNPFFQVSETSHFNSEGTGLGLAISKKLTLLMNGQIGVDSIYGEGSTFWFSAEFEIIKNETKVDKKAIIHNSDENNYNAKIDVLIAEDDPINQKLLSLILNRVGYYYEIAENGLIAVEKFKSRPFDIILMDIDMPKMDGIEATIKIRELEAINKTTNKICIIAVTAKTIHDDREKCIQAGMDDFISKPFKPEELLSCMSKLCSK